MSPRPPRLARWLVARVCPPEDRRFVLGDLDEELEARWKSEGPGAARRWYVLQVMRSVGPCLRRRLVSLLRTGSRGATADLLADVRYGGRRLLSAPVQGIVTVASLGIGIGLATAVFTVANAFLFAPPGGLDDTRGLVAVYTSDPEGSRYSASSFPDYQDVALEAGVFQGVLASRPGVVRWVDGEVSERLVVEMVTGNYFDVLGLRLPLGRGFSPDESVPGRAEPVIVLAHHVWEERFAADPSVLGRTLQVAGRDFVVIGVAPKGLLGRFLRLRVDGWVPIGLPGGLYHSTDQELVDRSDREYLVFGRLADGVTRAQAQARMDVLASRLHAEYPESWEDDRDRARVFTVLDEKDSRIPPDGKAALAGLALFMLAGTGLILLIACANVAGLFFARAARRRREIALRLSLGASRARVVRLLLVEALLLALAGGGLGVWIAMSASRLLTGIPLPIDVPLRFGVAVDGRVLLFALAVSVASCFAFGLAPAVRGTRTDLVSTLKGEGGGPRGRRVSFRDALVVFQVAASVLLLVCAGLFLRSAGAMSRMDRGLDTSDIALVSSTVRYEGASEDEFRRHLLDLVREVDGRPEVVEVSVASVPDASPWVGGARARLEVDGYVPSEAETMVHDFNSVTPGYFEMMGMTEVRGRLLRPSDDEGAPPVAVVNRTFAERYFPGREALGRRFTLLERRTFDTPYPAPVHTVEIVGVLPDVLVSPDQTAAPFFWTSFAQVPTPLAVIHARGRRGAAELVPVLREMVPPEGDDLQLVSPGTYDDLVAFMLLPQRIASKALSGAGAFALLLAVMGIYGIVSHAVSQRTREMAIRQAVGANRSDVRARVVLDGLRLAVAGSVIGLVLAVVAAHLSRRLLSGVSPLDPLAVGGGVGALLLAALLATVAPAWRATRMDPVEVLREE